MNNWFNATAWRHQNDDVLAFADGHIEYRKWRSSLPLSSYPGTPVNLTTRQRSKASPVCNKRHRRAFESSPE